MKINKHKKSNNNKQKNLLILFKIYLVKISKQIKAKLKIQQVYYNKKTIINSINYQN